MMIYLATPYNHEDKEVRSSRYWKAVEAVGILSKKYMGYFIYSPIVNFHIIALENNLPLDADYWKDVNLVALQKSDEIWVLRLPGWHVSDGVNMEVKWALKNNKPIKHIQPYPYTIIEPNDKKAGKLA